MTQFQVSGQEFYPIINVLTRSTVKKNSKFDRQRTDDKISIRKNISGKNKRFEDLVVKNNIDTVHKIWENSVKLYGEKNCLGTRSNNNILGFYLEGLP